MMEAGRWVTPLLEHRPWLEKPPLYYWMTIPFYACFGISEFTARAATALSALLAALVLLWVGSELWSRLAGLLAGGIFLTSVGSVAFGRAASTDMPFTACITVALSIFALAAVERVAVWKIVCAWIFLGLGILAKGPVALALAGGTGLVFWLLDEKGGVLARWRTVPGILIAAAVSLPWFWLAFQDNGFAFITTFVVNHNLARYITDIHHHTKPVYYFLLVLPGLIFPWSGWLITLAPRSFRETMRKWRDWDRPVLFLASWALFPLLFFSASSSKLPGYVLPSIPPLALLLGWRLAGWIEVGGKDERVVAAAWVHMLLSAGVSVAYPFVMCRRYGVGWAEALPVSAVALIPSIFALFYAGNARAERAVHATLVQGLIMVLALSQFAFPAIGQFDSTRDLALRIATVRAIGEPLVTYHFFHYTLDYYTGYTITADLQDRESLLAFCRDHGRFLAVVTAGGISELQQLPGFSCTLLGEQGRLCLLRLTRAP